MIGASDIKQGGIPVKVRLIALFLLLAIALAACSSGSSDLSGTVEAASGAGNVPDVDIGEIDGNTYRHVDLGFSVTFPDDWSLGESSVIVEENGEIASNDLDRAEVLDAVNAGDDVSIFVAHDADDLFTNVLLSVSLNPLPASAPDSDDFVNRFAPLIRQEYAAYDAWTLLSCDPFDADFCGEDHVALKLSVSGGSTQQFEKMLMYFPCGDLLYTLTVTGTDADAVAEILNLFEATD